MSAANSIVENMNKKSANPQYQKNRIKVPNIVVTYSWSSISHGICGHNFEAFELTNQLIQKGYPVTYLIPDNEVTGNNILQALDSKYINLKDIKDNILIGQPTVLSATAIVLCDGQLPTKGILEAKKLIMILCNKECKWTKNIKMFTGDKLELWYDERLEYPISQIIHEVHQLRPELQIILKPNYIKNLDFTIYKKMDAIEQGLKQKDIKRYMIYATGNCRDIYQADHKHQIDTMKEIRDILAADHEEKSLLIIGWNPNYIIEEKLYFNNNKDQKIFEDRKRAAITAEDLSDYFDCDVTIVPECDLPLDNLMMEFDTYIYTPTTKNWDCSSRLIPECRFFGKDLILTPSTKNMLDTNLGLKIRIEDYFPALLR